MHLHLQLRYHPYDRACEEEKRVAAAKASATAALAAKLIGYEGGFSQSADGDGGGQMSAAQLADGVVSAEHIPAPVGKVQAANDAVVLLLDGQPVQSLQRDGLTFVPVQLIDGAAAGSFEVEMEAPTLLYRTNTEARARKEQQISDANQRTADTTATLAELQQALTRGEAAFKAAVETAGDPDGNAELSDIGAMAIEKQRIKTEIAQQQAVQNAQQQELMDLQWLATSKLQLTEHRITPKFKLQSGFHVLRDPLTGLEQRLHVGRQLRQVAQAQVRFSHSITDAQ